jgi:hypothetical protein
MYSGRLFHRSTRAKGAKVAKVAKVVGLATQPSSFGVVPPLGTLPSPPPPPSLTPSFDIVVF